MLGYRSYLLLATFVAAISPSTAFSASCLENTSPGKICTANDFETITEELISGPANCTEGEIIPGDVVVRIGLLGNRVSTYDIGFFIGDADNSPINGESCTFDSLDRIEPGDGVFDGLSGDGPYRNLEGTSDNFCGDTDKNDGITYKDITLSNVLCQDSNNDGNLDVAYALTWKQNASACDDATNPDNFNLATTSKCIDTIGNIEEIPVLPPNPEIPSIRVQKTAEPLVISPGEDVDYTINVDNDGPVLVVLESLVDDKFGDLNGVGSCSVPQDIPPGQIYTCAFNEFPPGTAPGSHVNEVTGSGTGGGFPVSDSGSAIVDFVAPDKGAIGYLVWNDLNADGINQENETGIPGVMVNLYEERIVAPVATTTTDAEGRYAFQELDGGIYTVEVVESGPLGNLVRTTPANPIDVVLAPGDVFIYANFGYVGAEIQVEKTADPVVLFAPGGMVDYTVEVINSGVVDVELTDLADDKFGNLLTEGLCLQPALALAPGDVYSCVFTQQINGNPGDKHTNTVQAIAQDTVQGYPVFAADDATVGIEDPANASLGNLVWFDANANGVPDEGETGLDSVTLELSFDSDNDGSYETTIGTDVTQNSGEYGFIGLRSGNYRLTVTDDNGVLRDKYLTTPPDPLDITLAPGQFYGDADFGYALVPVPAIVVLKVPSERVVLSPSAEITYTIAVLNVGGTPVTIDQLIDSRFGDLNGKGTCSTGQPIQIFQRTAYTCEFTETIFGGPKEFHRNTVTATASDANGNIAHDSGPAAVLFLAPDNAAIGDLVWEDLNANGVFDAGEPGIGNVSIDLYQGPTLIGTTTTDASGNYQFSALAAGDYQVRVTDTAGVLTGKVLTAGIDPTDVSLVDGQIYADADFGYASGAIEVVKTGNRVVLLEPGGNVTYTITTRNTSYLDLTLTTLDDDQFGNLAGQGTCALPVALPARSSVACQFTRSINGAANETHTNIVTATASDSGGNAVSAEANFTVRFVGINFGASGYLVWNDENGNGIRESSEPGFSGVTLDLEVDEDNNGSFEKLASTAVTNSSGYYAFIPVPAGNWRIRVTDRYGVLAGRELTGGTNPNNFVLSGGQIYRDANFGYYFDTGGLPVLPPPQATPKSIPATPRWALVMLVLVSLGLGLYARQRRAARQ